MPTPIGHALAGMTAAWMIDLVPGDRAWRTAPPGASWLERAGGRLTLGCAALGAAPDLDLLVAGHRTVTHSIGAVIVVGLVAAAIASRTPRPAVRIAAMCAAAWFTHVLLDWLGADPSPPFGVQALWPFSHQWYISGLDLFRGTERRLHGGGPFLKTNALAVVQEVAILAPAAAAVWLVRVKALAGLATELARRHHAAQ